MPVAGRLTSQSNSHRVVGSRHDKPMGRAELGLSVPLDASIAHRACAPRPRIYRVPPFLGASARATVRVASVLLRKRCDSRVHPILFGDNVAGRRLDADLEFKT